MAKSDRCSVLDDNGRQCNGVAVVKYSHSGDREISCEGYHSYVAVFFCQKHYKQYPFKGIGRMRLANKGARHGKES